MVVVLIQSMANPLYTEIESTEIIKKYQLIYSLIIISLLSKIKQRLFKVCNS